MPPSASVSKLRMLFGCLLGTAVLCGVSLPLNSRPAGTTSPPPTPDEQPNDLVGAIEGDAIVVQGPMTVRVENGEVKTILRSGSDVRVKNGQARIDLVEGGQIVICGPAHLSVLKAGGALTLALDSGTIHARIESQPALTVYTAQIQARPIAIGDGTKDVLVGFDSPGVMCLRAKSGALRLEQQLTGQDVVLPQAGDILLSNGTLSGFRPGAGHCTCELQLAKTLPSPSPAVETSVIASARESKPAPAEKKSLTTPAPPTMEGQRPVYQVFMPPLRYDANAKVQDEPDPRLILLVRRVRVRPTLIFEGEVEGDPIIAANAPQPVHPSLTESQPKVTAPHPGTSPANESVVERVRTFFRKLWSKSS